MKIFENAGEYKHFKGGNYLLICSALCEGENVILYKSEKSNSYWMRTPDDFFEILKRDGEEFPRFKQSVKFNKEGAVAVFQEFISRMKNGETITFENNLAQFAIDFSAESLQSNSVECEILPPRVIAVK